MWKVPGGASGAGKLAYNIVRESDGKVIIDGADYFARTCEVTPQAKNVLAFDGLTVSIRCSGACVRCILGGGECGRAAFRRLHGLLQAGRDFLVRRAFPNRER